MKKRIFVRGPVLSQSGYGEQARFALRALRSREDLFDIYVQPIAWGQTGWVWEQSEFREWMDERILLTQVAMKKNQLTADISLQITIPNEFQRLCPINIGYTAGIETTKVAPVWLQKGNDMDKILVVSEHAKQTYASTTAQAQNQQTNETVLYKMHTPITVVHETTPRASSEPIPGLELDYDFNFLCISQISTRKNFENTIRWWVEEFVDQEVGLILKASMVSNSHMDMGYTDQWLQSILSKYKNRKCKVYLLHGDLSSGQMTWLYSHDKVKSMVNIAHGEGFGLPMFEAAREALPIVTIGWSGQVDFLVHDGKEMFSAVEYTIQPVQKHAVWKGVIEKNSMWAYAEQGSYKMKLRDMRKNWEKHKEVALQLQSINSERFSDDKLYAGFVDAILSQSKDEEEMIVI